VELPSLGQHLDEGLEAAGPCLGSLRGLEPPGDGVAIGAVEVLEELSRPAVAGQRFHQVFGRSGAARRIIGLGPPPVLLGCVDLRLTGRLHPPGGDQALAGTLIWSDAARGWIAEWRLDFEGKPYRWRISGVSFDEAFRNALRGAAQVLSGNGEPQS